MAVHMLSATDKIEIAKDAIAHAQEEFAALLEVNNALISLGIMPLGKDLDRFAKHTAINKVAFVVNSFITRSELVSPIRFTDEEIVKHIAKHFTERQRFISFMDDPAFGITGNELIILKASKVLFRSAEQFFLGETDTLDFLEVL